MIFGDKELETDLRNCSNLPSKWTEWCKDKAKSAWMRRLSWIKDVVYPWNNKDWDYKQFVKNNYDPEDVLGLRRGGNMDELIGNISIIVKQLESLISVANPNDNSVAGISDQPSTNNPRMAQIISLKQQLAELKRNPEGNRNQIEALAGALNELVRSRAITSKEYGIGIAAEGSFQQPPYNDPFFNKPIRGEGSSSYFIQTGFCTTKDNSQQDCKNKKFIWLGDTCYKPKFIYINNSPGFKIGRLRGLKGLVPSMVNDISQITPDSLLGILQGYSVPGVDIQQCDTENFIDYGNSNKNRYNLLMGIAIIAIIVLIFLTWKI
jgi:hypothetical protein